jgi:hypothetical protein
MGVERVRSIAPRRRRIARPAFWVLSERVYTAPRAHFMRWRK